LKSCRDGDLIISSYILQGVLYGALGSPNKSIYILKKAIKKYQKPENAQDISDECLWVNDAFFGSYIVTDYTIFRTISKMYIKEAKYDSALFYLDKIDRNSIPHYSGDIDGQIQIETSIAIQYTECYLGLGDTTSSINKLLLYSIFNKGLESKYLLKILKPLLHSKYSKDQIIKEIESSIILAKEIKKTNKNGFEGHSIEYIFFGQKIPFLYLSMSEFERFIKNNENLLYLKS
jgi:tetratricopeptide (TPR) repeat protein